MTGCRRTSVLAAGATGLLVAAVLSAVAQQAVQKKPLVDSQVPGISGKDLTVNQQGKPEQAAPPQLTAFTTKEGKKGWKVVIPGNRPLATPAIADGKVLVGGGFGSHEFYAFDATTGKTSWVYQTGDDGPTAAVVADGYIAFNTESCELEILTMEGKRVWKKWLGDPLMSMPAISKGRVYMAYPDSKGNRGHQLACFDIKTGQEFWKHPIAGDIITAPVIADGKVYLATVEGTMYCFAESSGQLAWKEKKNATSSPTVWNGKCLFSQREVVLVKDKNGKEIKQQTEQLTLREPGQAGVYVPFSSTKTTADYLDYEKRKDHSSQEKSFKKADGAVGFSLAPAAANLPQAQMNLGQGSVAGVWSYQGSRPFVYKNRLYSTMGDTVKCVDPAGNKVLWKKNLHEDKNKHLVDAAVTPPALVNGKIFVGTVQGEVICLEADSGQELWRATVGEPIVFQPAVAGGRVYVASSSGSLFCIETGDANDHGWLMWGGNAAHNGMVK